MSRILITPIVLFYSPIGLFLVILRSLLLIYVFLASVVLYSVPPLKRLVLRMMCSLLGFIVTSEGLPAGKPDQPLVSNCVTLFDHMGMNLITNCVTPYKFMVSWALSWRHLNYEEPGSRNKINEVFHLQPEEHPQGTNSKFMIKFNKSPFKLFHKVQPVAISVRTFLPINLSVHPLDWKYEVFWVLFSPCVHLHIAFLEPITVPETVDRFTEAEGDEDTARANRLCAETRNCIAQKLGLKELDSKLDSKTSSEPKSSPNHHHIQQSSPVTTLPEVPESYQPVTEDRNNSNDVKMDPRVSQVLAVLPEFEPALISGLLERFNDVDAVIAHVLERASSGHHEESNNQCPVPKISLSGPCSHRVAAMTFSRDPTERHQSFADRKAIFLDNARRRYLQLHPSS